MSNFIFSPLEQFEILPLFFYFFSDTEGVSSPLVGFLWVVSNIDFAYLLAGSTLVVFFYMYGSIKLLYSNYVMTGVNLFYQTLRSMLLSSINQLAITNLGLLSTLFLIILSLNVTGLIPFGFCITSQIIITQFLGCFAVIGLTLKGIQTLRIKFLNLFVPRNVPLVLLPFLVVIEFISFISRMFSLSIRLFANMVAGHALLHILMGAVLSIFKLSLSSAAACLLFIIPSLIIFVIVLLEIGIAFLQSYVFVVLVSIYLSDAYKSH